HLATSDPLAVEKTYWSAAIGLECCLQVVRPATGGMKKITAIFDSGQIDLVVVPTRTLRLIPAVLKLGWYGRSRMVTVALDEMATCLHSGYRFLKGGPKWESLYAKVATLQGVRINDADACAMARVF